MISAELNEDGAQYLFFLENIDFFFIFSSYYYHEEFP